MGRLERKLDTALIGRMDAGWKPSDKPTISHRRTTPRKAETYRAARRNKMRERQQ